ncbi:MAG: DUF4159 domain-containing protein [Gammaproteobacteria bacterium]|nr:DUF4159 domain-containing protein [Gammaproteobacteria bacterium]
MMRTGALTLLLLLVSVAALAQFDGRRSPFGRRMHTNPAATAGTPQAEFNFTRLIYSGNSMDDMGRGFGGWGSWRTDWPEAEQHLIQGIRRLTLVETADDGQIVQLFDDALFDFPMLYAVEVGRMELSQAEADRLREYLLRGGFLMVDDFHGSLQWRNFDLQMRRVFPDREIVEIDEADEVMHVMFDLNKKMQIAGIFALQFGVTFEQDGVTPHWRGIYDDDGRLMVAINFNMDLGDAWEHADWPEYPEPMTAMAYRFGVNYLIYAMTH